MPLPNQGDQNWAGPLNDYILNVVGAEASSAETLITTHESATDPHGDRAFASGLATGITAQYGIANGVAQLGADGRLKATQAPPGGGVTNFYDVMLDFGAVGNGTHDDAPNINNALTAAANAGGGEVWVPSGTFGIGATLVIGANTWLHLAPGAKIVRLANPTPPAVMLANYTPTTAPAVANIHVSGGQWDAFNSSMTQQCNVFSFFNAGFCLFEQTRITGPENSSAILLAGCTAIVIDKLQFAGPVPTHARSFYSTACIRLEPSNSSVVAGLLPATYTGLGCSQIIVTRCPEVATTTTDGSGPYTKYNYFVATIVTGVTHSNLFFNFNYGNGLANNALSPSSWSTVTLVGNQFVNSGSSINITGITNLQSSANTPGTGAVVSGWTQLTLQNSWSTVSGEMAPSYRMTPTGDIDIAGVMSGGSANSNTIIATLPSGFFNTSTACRIPLMQSGSQTISGFSGGTVSWPYLEIDTSGNMRIRNLISSPGQVAFAGTVYKFIPGG